MTDAVSQSHPRDDAILARHRWSALDAAARERLLDRATGKVRDPQLQDAIAALIERVRVEGDAAVVEATRRFDGCEVAPDALRVGADEIARARERVAPDVVAAIRFAIDRCRRFNERVLAEHGDWQAELEPGLTVGERSTPIASAGLFVPSGKASYPSVMVQLGAPAVTAGVPELAVVVPPAPGSDGAVDPAVLVAADELGIAQVFRANGPAGVAALALGTESIPKVLKVLGPGSPAVAAAQLLVQRYGCVSHVLLGPSEMLILADGSADPALLAVDLLCEAEHGGDSASVLVTDDAELVDRVERELAPRLAALPEPRRGFASSALGTWGGAILVEDIDAGVEVANLYAAEHMQLAVADPAALLPRIRHAGEAMLGQDTPNAAANFVIGVPAALPTGRFARVASGVTARAFLKTMSVAHSTPAALDAMAQPILALSEHEGFPAHAASVSERLAGVGR